MAADLPGGAAHLLGTGRSSYVGCRSRLNGCRFIPGYANCGAFGIRDLLDRAGNASQRCTEVGKVNQGEQQPCDPEDVEVGEERDQAEDGDDLVLEFLSFMG